MSDIAQVPASEPLVENVTATLLCVCLPVRQADVLIAA